MSNLRDCTAATSSQLAHCLESFLTTTCFEEGPDLLWLFLQDEALVCNVKLNDRNHRVVAGIPVKTTSFGARTREVVWFYLALIKLQVVSAAFTMEALLVFVLSRGWGLLLISLTRTVLVKHIEWTAHLRILIRTCLVISRPLTEVLPNVGNIMR